MTRGDDSRGPDASAADWQELEDEGFIRLVGPFHEDRNETSLGRFRFIAEDKHRNRSGFVQGGMLMTFADRSMGTLLRRGHRGWVFATAQLDVHFVSVARIGAEVVIDARITRETTNLVFATGTIFSEDRVVATVSGIWSILKRSDRG